MLISALNDYYDILAKDNNNVLPDGYSKVKIHYLIALNKEGKLTDITVNGDNPKSASKVDNPKEFKFPKRTEKTCIDSNFIEHRATYIFGLNYEKDRFTTEDKTNKAKNSHEAFCKVNLEFIDGIYTPIVNAFRNFILNFKPEQETENPKLLEIAKYFKTSNFAFCLEGRPDILLNEDEEINKKWKKVYYAQGAVSNESLGQCAVSGKIAEISRLHNKIKGFNSMGSVLIGVNEEAYESYGCKQGFNSNISKEVMERYTEALNYLLQDKKHKQFIDGTTIIYFAMNKQEEYIDAFNDAMFDNFDKDDATQMDAKLDEIGENMKMLKITESALKTDKLDNNVDFYIFGLRPNSSRLALKFIYKKEFGKIMRNIAKHQEDLKIYEDSKPISLSKIMYELKPNTNKKAENDPALSEKIFSAIINGYNYPIGLLDTVIRRIKTDNDKEEKNIIKFRKINSTRIGIIKAYLNRKSRLSGKKEEITMALNENYQNASYLCGRLFALLEKAQIEAYKDENGVGKELNKTIKDSYFSSACSTPSIIFPRLIKLAQYHLAKAKYGPQINYEIGKIMNKLENEFPKNLSLDEQGKFMLGYYQQFYKKHNTENLNNEEEK